MELNVNQCQVEIRAAQLTAARQVEAGGGLQVMTPHWTPVLVHGDVNAPDKTGSMARDLGWGLCAKDLLVARAGVAGGCGW